MKHVVNLKEAENALELEIEEDVEHFHKQGAKEVSYNQEDSEALEKAVKECKYADYRWRKGMQVCRAPRFRG